VRVSSSPKLLPSPIGIEAARDVLKSLRALPGHRFLIDDVSIADADVPALAGYRQVTDAHLLALARRHGVKLVTFDSGVLALGDGESVELLPGL
jgi:predicted nucleic acid-binding protein